jgi:hypothetical protein
MRTHESVAVPASSHHINSSEMYPKAFTRSGRSRHSRRCTAAFGRHDYKCHRCVELMLGAAPRGSWHEDFYAKKLGQVQRSFNF